MMPQMIESSFQALKQKRLQSLSASADAARHFPQTYREIKTVISRIIDYPLDVSEYYKTACHLAELIKILAEDNRGSFFPHFEQTIDPHKDGDVKYFRFECLDLSRQLACLDKWRAKHNRLRVVK